jgi:hypothetical protein
MTAPTAITPIQLSKNPTTATAHTWTAADVANGNSFASTGREVVLANNTDSGSHHVTMTSSADPILGRTKDITSVSVAAGAYVELGMPQVSGWQQSDGTVHLSADDATMKFLILRTPS